MAKKPQKCAAVCSFFASVSVQHLSSGLGSLRDIPHQLDILYPYSIMAGSRFQSKKHIENTILQTHALWTQFYKNVELSASLVPVWVALNMYLSVEMCFRFETDQFSLLHKIHSLLLYKTRLTEPKFLAKLDRNRAKTWPKQTKFKKFKSLFHWKSLNNFAENKSFPKFEPLPKIPVSIFWCFDVRSHWLGPCQAAAC